MKQVLNLCPDGPFMMEEEFYDLMRHIMSRSKTQDGITELKAWLNKTEDINKLMCLDGDQNTHSYATGDQIYSMYLTLKQ